MEIVEQPVPPSPEEASGPSGGSNGAEPAPRGAAPLHDGAGPKPGLIQRVTARVLSDQSLTKKASLNAAASTAEQVARITVGLLITPFLVSRLGDAAYGIWQVLQRLIGHASPASGRPGEALKWSIAHDQSSTDHERKRRQVGNAVAVWALFVPVLALVGGVLAWFSPVWLGVHAASFTTVRLAAGLLVVDAIVFGLLCLPQAVLQGENLGYKRLGISIMLVVASKTVLGVAVYLGFGLVGMGVAEIAGTVFWGVMYIQITRSRVAWFGIAKPSFAEVRGFIRLSWWFLVWNLVMQVMNASDVTVLGVLTSPALVTTYTLAKYLPQAIIVAVATLIFAVMPGLGGLIGAGQLRRAVRIRNETMSLVWLFTVAAGTTVLAWERSFLGLWIGERYYPGAVAILLIMLMVFQWSLIRVDSNIIDLTLNLRRKVLLGMLSAVLSAGLACVFLSVFHLGIIGLVIGFMLGRAIQSIAYPLMIGRTLGIPVPDQLRGLVRPGLATAALFGVSATVGAVAQAGSWFVLVAGTGTTALVASVLALAFGLPPRQRRFVWNRVRRVVRLT
ncbi:MAG: lipopolysaccharide biosynthesis protein [Candidatus Velamenicoccus archaeovorus]